MDGSHTGATHLDATAVARHAIRLIEQQIAQEFGYRPVMGAEIEYSITSPAVTQSPAYPLLPGFDKAAKQCGTSPSATRIPLQKDTLFPESPYISHSYREIGGNMCSEQYEVVISHEARYRNANHFADVIDATRHQLRALNRPAGFIPSPHPRGRIKLLQQQHSRLEQVIKDANIEEISLLGYHTDDHYTNGLHLNLSLTTLEGHPALSERMRTHYYKHILAATLELMQDNAYLFSPNPQAEQRWKQRYSRTHNESAKQIRFKSHLSDPGCYYLENALLSADVNAQFAVLFQLCAVYEGLCNAQNHHDQPLIPEFTYENIANSTERKARFCAPENPLRQRIDQLSPGLGATFCQAVADHPESRGIAQPVRSYWR